jgi:hypothetical protein
MEPFRIRRRVAVAAGLALLGMLVAQGSPHAAATEPLLRPTPLVLKDGRLAKVSVHILPFAPGEADLASEPAGYLAKLTRAVDTDCFLTAQVIGHIAFSEVADDDSWKANRLARERADAVHASLIDGGLPMKAIASVWDWQFMVREPRATLWVFELPPRVEQGNAEPERVTRAAAAPAEPLATPVAKPALVDPSASTAGSAAEVGPPVR